MTITFKVSPEIGFALKAAAARKRISVSKYVRDALDAGLRREEKKPFKSVAEAMREIGAIGCFDGPPDLATNPKYMKGFGKWRK